MTIMIEGLGATGQSPGSAHFDETRKAVKAKGETLYNMAVVIAAYKTAAREIETKMQPKSIWWTSVAYQKSNYPPLMAGIKAEATRSRDGLQVHIDRIAELMKTAPGSIYPQAADVWTLCQRIALNVDAADALLVEASEPPITIKSIVSVLKDYFDLAKEGAGALKDAYLETLKEAVDLAVKAGGLVASALPWWVYPTIGLVGVGALLYVTSPFWLALGKAKITSRVLTQEERGLMGLGAGRGRRRGRGRRSWVSSRSR